MPFSSNCFACLRVVLRYSMVTLSKISWSKIRKLILSHYPRMDGCLFTEFLFYFKKKPCRLFFEKKTFFSATEAFHYRSLKATTQQPRHNVTQLLMAIKFTLWKSLVQMLWVFCRPAAINNSQGKAILALFKIFIKNEVLLNITLCVLISRIQTFIAAMHLRYSIDNFASS